MAPEIPSRATKPVGFDTSQRISNLFSFLPATPATNLSDSEDGKECNTRTGSDSDGEDSSEGGDATPGASESARALSQPKKAWMLYDFEGVETNGELRLTARTPLLVIHPIYPPSPPELFGSPETLADRITSGWLLALDVSTGIRGLVPQSYISYTPLPHLPVSAPPRLLPQQTGSKHQSLREGLLKGRALNRFSTFVTSGAESYILNGTVPPLSLIRKNEELPSASTAASTDQEEEEMGAEVHSGVGESDTHYISDGPSWRAKSAPFQVRVHSPSKRKSHVGLTEFIIYLVTSTFPTTNGSTPVEITVERRFSNFVSLSQLIGKKFPGLALPPLPEKVYVGRFGEGFIEARRGELERWLARVVRHPVVRYSDAIVGFFSCESEGEWKRLAPALAESPVVGPLFYANVFHPEFNLDIEDATSQMERFVVYVKAVAKSVESLRAVQSRGRQIMRDSANHHKSLALALTALITSKPSSPNSLMSHPGLIPPSPPTSLLASIVEPDQAHDRVWCWHESCLECKKLTKGIRTLAETLAEVSEIEAEQAKITTLRISEALKDVAHPDLLYAPVIETHRDTLTRYADVNTELDLDSESLNRNKEEFRESMVEGAGRAAVEMAERCETVLNSTMSETSHYHDTKNEDFKVLATTYLDGEIAHLKKKLAALEGAREVFEKERYDSLSDKEENQETNTKAGSSSRLNLEKELEESMGGYHLSVGSLTQPTPSVYDSSLIRPVSAAASVLGGSLLGGSSIFIPGLSQGGNGRLSGWFW